MGVCTKGRLLQNDDSQGATMMGFQGRYGVAWQFDHVKFVSEGHPNFTRTFLANGFFHHALRRFVQLIPLLLGHMALQVQYPRPYRGLNDGDLFLF